MDLLALIHVKIVGRITNIAFPIEMLTSQQNCSRPCVVLH